MSIPLQTVDPHARRVHGQHQADTLRYQALESPDTFRLLKLLPGRGEKIDCSLHHFLLGSRACPNYRAVSYTWGKDAARNKIHLSDGSILKVRKNLWTALRFIRDESECWLWIDAICIDQDSPHERNHQVRRMSDIYGNANRVLVWLESSGVDRDVAKAFKFVHAAVAHDNSEHSVYHYSTAHPGGNESNWDSVHKLCTMRYWSRKWIIQELMNARTVVLQSGSSVCSMADLDRFCRQLLRNRDDHRYQNMTIARHKIWKAVSESPAARLTLSRTDAAHQRQPRLLRELIEQYASNECEQPCDHVYALHSLVGQNRERLQINYEAQPLERLVAVLRFVDTYEALEPSKVVEFTTLLLRLLKINEEDLVKERKVSEGLNLEALVTIIGTVERPEEPQASIALRETIHSLPPIPSFSLNTSQSVWVVTASESFSGSENHVNRQDMTYFRIANSALHGLAACRPEAGDTIWHLPKTQLVFVVRQHPDHRASILGRAYLFASPAKDANALEPWVNQSLDYNSVGQGERRLSLDLATLLDLGGLAVSTDVSVRWMKSNVGAVWKKNTPFQVVVIVGSVLIFGMLLAALLVQVDKR